MIVVKDVSYTYMTGTPFEKTALNIAGLIKLTGGTVKLDGLRGVTRLSDYR